jgi:hypothetical protein
VWLAPHRRSQGCMTSPSSYPNYSLGHYARSFGSRSSMLLLLSYFLILIL